MSAPTKKRASKPINYLAAGIFGGAAGWFIGYMVVLQRFEDMGPLAKAIGTMGAPRAPDTILFAAIGVGVGCLFAALANHRLNEGGDR